MAFMARHVARTTPSAPPSGLNSPRLVKACSESREATTLLGSRIRCTTLNRASSSCRSARSAAGSRMRTTLAARWLLQQRRK
eukprot:scaffold5498_cov75-Phaeocystis_antarctica.AAC.4